MAQQPSQEMETIARILAGERDLFHELIRPYERRVYTTALAVLRDPGEAEDAAQDAVLKAYQALKSFRGDAKFGTWLITITLNEARSRLRKSGRVALESLDTAENDDYLPFLVADWREIPSETLERKELAMLIDQAIAALPPSYREVFLLRDKDELSIEEIAQVVGVKANLVKVRLFRARMMLQKQLAPLLKQQASPRRRWFSWMGGKA